MTIKKFFEYVGVGATVIVAVAVAVSSVGILGYGVWYLLYIIPGTIWIPVGAVPAIIGTFFAVGWCFVTLDKKFYQPEGGK